MTRLRLAAAALLAAAAVIGTAIDRLPDRAPVRAGDYWVLSGDFHVHAFPGDGHLVPWELRRQAAREGLDVITVSNHNQLFTARFAQWLASSDGPIVIAGQEITHPAYHLIGVGLSHPVNADQPAAGAIADVHAQGGVAIAAHPWRRYPAFRDERVVAMLDGTETAHPYMYDNAEFGRDIAAFYERGRQLNPRLAAIGSSDFHSGRRIGLCRTLLLVRARSAAGVLDAIRGGRTAAVDADGQLRGDAAVLRQLAGARPDGPVEGDEWWRRLSVTLAWVAVLGLVVLR